MNTQTGNRLTIDYKVVEYKVLKRKKQSKSKSKYVGWVEEPSKPRNEKEMKDYFGVIDWIRVDKKES